MLNWIHFIYTRWINLKKQVKWRYFAGTYVLTLIVKNLYLFKFFRNFLTVSIIIWIIYSVCKIKHKVSHLFTRHRTVSYYWNYWFNYWPLMQWFASEPGHVRRVLRFTMHQNVVQTMLQQGRLLLNRFPIAPAEHHPCHKKWSAGCYLSCALDSGSSSLAKIARIK